MNACVSLCVECVNLLVLKASVMNTERLLKFLLLYLPNVEFPEAVVIIECIKEEGSLFLQFGVIHAQALEVTVVTMKERYQAFEGG